MFLAFVMAPLSQKMSCEEQKKITRECGNQSICRHVRQMRESNAQAPKKKKKTHNIPDGAEEVKLKRLIRQMKLPRYHKEGMKSSVKA